MYSLFSVLVFLGKYGQGLEIPNESKLSLRLEQNKNKHEDVGLWSLAVVTRPLWDEEAARS